MNVQSRKWDKERPDNFHFVIEKNISQGWVKQISKIHLSFFYQDKILGENWFRILNIKASVINYTDAVQIPDFARLHRPRLEYFHFN